MAGTLGGERLVGRDDGSNDQREEECVSHLTVVSKVRSGVDDRLLDQARQLDGRAAVR